MALVEPRLFLRGIDGAKLFERYLQGEFSKNQLIKLQNESKVVKINFKPSYGHTPLDSIYEYKDSNNKVKLVITTDHQKFALISNGSSKKLCQWCRRPIRSTSLGIPIKMEHIDGKYIFYITGTFDTFECAYSRVVDKNKGTHYRDPVYLNSEPMLKSLFEIIYPERTLLKLPEWDLLEENGGPLKEEKYFSQESRWVELPSIIIKIGKREIMEIKID